MAYIASLIYFLFPAIAGALSSPRVFAAVCMVIGPLNIVGSENIITPFGNLNLLSIKALGILVGAIITLVRSSFSNQLKNFVPLPHIIFVLFFILSISWSPSIEFAVRGVQKLLLPLVFVYIGFAIGQHQLPKSLNDNLVGSAIIGTAFFMSILSIVLKLGGFFSSVGLSFPVIGQAVFSVNVAVAAVTCFSRFMVRRETLWLIASLMLVGVVFGAFVRISIVAAFVGMSVLLFLEGRGVARIVTPIIVVTVMVMLFFFVPELKERMFLGHAETVTASDLLDKPEELAGLIAGSGRYELWDMLLNRLFWPHPLSGSGVGAAQLLLYTGEGAQAPHSDYVRLLCDGGILGLFSFILLVIWYYFKILKDRKNHKRYIRERVLSAAGALAVYTVFMATDNAFDYVTQLGIQAFILVGIALGFSNVKNGRNGMILRQARSR